MRILILTETDSDLAEILSSSAEQADRMSPASALTAELGVYDAYAVLTPGQILDARLRQRLEAENGKGKRVFTEALPSWLGVCCADPEDTTRCRLVALNDEEEEGIPGLGTGDLLDDESNTVRRPWFSVPGMRPLLVYREHIIAHRHLSADRDTILKDSRPGLWHVGDKNLMSSFVIHDFNRARFAPRDDWWKVIVYITRWLTGCEPVRRPEPVIRHGVSRDLSDPAAFDACLREAVDRGAGWLRGFLVDGGAGGIREGLRHNIDPSGRQMTADTVRTDCAGESAGAFAFRSFLTGDGEDRRIADRLMDFVFGPMMIRNGLYDGMIRWGETGWEICYQDDVARAILPVLYDSLFLGNDGRLPDVFRSLDFLVRTTATDGCRVFRTDIPLQTPEEVTALSKASCGTRSAHYNAYYHAALLLAHRCGGSGVYLDTARRGLETLMAAYPCTQREQSETEEMCRLILPLAALYGETGEEAHRAMLYRVARDLEEHRHPSGGYAEWDTGYRAVFSRESDGECSILTENGDPVADLLYSVNWLPMGFAYAWHVTGDRWFRDRWEGVVRFLLNVQNRSGDRKLDGSFFRAFDMEIGEAYACPHDVGWAACSAETGWTNAEILMGMMLPEVLARSGRDKRDLAE